MKVVVTGASGRVGRAISVLLMRDHEVVGIDRTPSSTVRHCLELSRKSSRATLLRALRGADALIHTAALHAPQVGLVAEKTFQQVNVDLTAELVDMCTRLNVPRLVFTSTTALFGSASHQPDRAAWLTEATPPEPRTIYHRTKWAAEQLLESAARQGGPAVRALRMSRCFPEPAPTMAVFRLHRGIDARDVAFAHRAALSDPCGPWACWIVSGATPFRREDAPELSTDAPAVLRRRAPDLVGLFAARGWPLPARIDRVYDPSLAHEQLGWRSRFGPAELLADYDQWSSEILPPDRGLSSAPAHSDLR